MLLSMVAAAHAGLADLHGRELRQGRGALRSIIPPEHAGIFSNVVEACAAVLPSELLQLSFGALLKMDTVFADRRASEPSVARRATGPAWGALLRAPTARVRIHGARVRAGAQRACPRRRSGWRAVSPTGICRAVAEGSL